MAEIPRMKMRRICTMCKIKPIRKADGFILFCMTCVHEYRINCGVPGPLFEETAIQ